MVKAWSHVAVVGLALFFGGCVFSPSQYVCESGERSDGKTCESGVWVDGVGTSDMGADACQPQSEIEFCEGYCGERTAADNCGTSRTIICPDDCAANGSQCGGGGEDNVCGCADDVASCSAVECGEVSVAACVPGEDDRVLDCGMCRIANSQCVVNTCECDDGFSRNGNVCDDVDECATDPCGAEQTCNNLPGSFECLCPVGFSPNGMACDPDPLALKVYTESVQVVGVMSSIDITNLFNNNANVVPFMSANYNDATASEYDRASLNVSIVGNAVQVTRDDATGIAEATVSLVEFDPTLVKVQTGSFNIPDGDRTLRIPIELVDTDKAFVVFYNKASVEDFDRRIGVLRVELSEDEVRFDRDVETEDIDGNWWVVEALQDGFEVQESTRNLDDTDQDVDFNTVDVNKTMLLYSYRSVEPGPDASHYSCQLIDDETVNCDRFNGAERSSGNVQLISFNGVENVLRGTEVMDTDVATVAINQDPAKAMPLMGQLGVGGAVACTATDETTTWSAYVRAAFIANGATLQLNRGGPDETARAYWQVVQWFP